MNHATATGNTYAYAPPIPRVWRIEVEIEGDVTKADRLAAKLRQRSDVNLMVNDGDVIYVRFDSGIPDSQLVEIVGPSKDGVYPIPSSDRAIEDRVYWVPDEYTYHRTA